MLPDRMYVLDVLKISNRFKALRAFTSIVAITPSFLISIDFNRPHCTEEPVDQALLKLVV